MTEFHDFERSLQGIARDVLAKNSRGRDLPPYFHMVHRDGRQESLHVGLPPDQDGRRDLIVQSIVPLVRDTDVELVGWTFEGISDGDAVAVVIAIDRERSQTWWAWLARPRSHDETLIGAFRPLPANQQAGALITPLQEALR